MMERIWVNKNDLLEIFPDKKHKGKKLSTHEERLHIAKETIKGMRAAVKAVESYMGMEVRVHWNGRVKVDGQVFWENEIENLDTKEILENTYWKTENGLSDMQ